MLRRWVGLPPRPSCRRLLVETSCWGNTDINTASLIALSVRIYVTPSQPGATSLNSLCLLFYYDPSNPDKQPLTRRYSALLYPTPQVTHNLRHPNPLALWTLPQSTTILFTSTVIIFSTTVLPGENNIKIQSGKVIFDKSEVLNSHILVLINPSYFA